MAAGRMYKAPRPGRGLTKKQKTEVKKILGHELEAKYLSIEGSGTVSTAGSVHDILQIAEGTDEGQRAGDEVSLKSLEIQYNIIAAHDATWIAADPYNVLRVVIFRWRMDDGTDAPTVAKLFDTSTSGSVYPTNYMFNYENRHKYKILYDKNHMIANTALWDSDSNTAKFVGGVGSFYNTGRAIRFYGKRLGKSIVRFNDDAVSGTDKIYLITVSDSTAGDHPDLNFAGRVTYTDA